MGDQVIIEAPVDIEQFINKTAQNKKIHQGMPALEKADKPISFFEFWPGYIFYIPVVFQWLWLSIRYKGIGLPLNANPNIPLSGMVSETKSGIFSQASGEAEARIAPWVLLTSWDNASEQLQNARRLMKKKEINYPIVAKPDIGCRGAGVKVIRNDLQLIKYIRDFPESGDIILQKLIPYEAEAGIFYIRYPGTDKGEIFSITLKYQPYVIGNGVSTLQQLIEADPRAGQLKHLYLSRHQEHLKDVLPEGQPFRLAFAGSHSRGCIFRDGREFITPDLAKSLDKVCNDLPEFYYGRFDIRFRDIDSLVKGEDYYILEVNGASSEAAHIWDCRSTIPEVFRVLFYQYRTLFQIGAINKRRGFRPPSLISLIKGWWKERALVRQYPDTD